jgi:hypothetical protein
MENKEVLLKVAETLTNAGAQMRDLANKPELAGMTDLEVSQRADRIMDAMESAIEGAGD